MLEAVARRKDACGVSELATELEMTKSNVYRLLQTLSAADYVRHDPVGGTYAASVKVLELGLLVGSHIDEREVAQPILSEIVARTEENASIGILDGAEVLFIDRVDSPQRLRAVARDGERLPAHLSSCGKVLLAHAGDAALDAIQGRLAAGTDRPAPDMDDLRRELAAIRDQGHCFSRGEWHPDISSVAVPVVNRRGRVTSALMVSGPTSRVTEAKLPAFLRALTWGAAEVASLLP